MADHQFPLSGKLGKWVTVTLTTTLTNSERNECPLNDMPKQTVIFLLQFSRAAILIRHGAEMDDFQFQKMDAVYQSLREIYYQYHEFSRY